MDSGVSGLKIMVGPGERSKPRALSSAVAVTVEVVACSGSCEVSSSLSSDLDLVDTKIKRLNCLLLLIAFINE